MDLASLPAVMGPSAVLAASGVAAFPIILLGFAIILGLALVGRFVMSKLGQPGVLGEIGMGMLLGNVGVALAIPSVEIVAEISSVNAVVDTMLEENVSLSVAGRQVLTLARPDAAEDAKRIVDLLNGPDGQWLLSLGQAANLFSQFGVVLLMFMTGLRATVGQLAAAGGSAVRVASAGALLPFGAVLGVSLLLRDGEPMLAHLFLAALFVDTILGLTARIFADAGHAESREAQVVLGAGVMNQVLMLILVAVLSTLARSAEPGLGAIGSVVGLALVYIGLLSVFGERLVRVLVPLFDRLDFRSGRFLFAVSLVFLLAWLAALAGLSPVMGGFAAGLILNEARLPAAPGRVSVRDRSAPLEALFSPVFFVLVGMRVELKAFADPASLGLAGALVAAGLLTKLAAGWFAGPSVARRVVGLAMMPRGGITLIFAGIGRELDLISDNVFAAMAIFVIVSMVVSGSLLQKALASLGTPPEERAAS